MATVLSYRITGLVFLIVGVLFFLRDMGVNYVGTTDALTLLLILIGAGLLAGGISLQKPADKVK